MKKRLIALVLALVFVLALTACSSTTPSASADNNTSANNNVPADNNAPADNNTPADDGDTLDVPAVTLTCAGYLPSGNSFEEFVLNPLQTALDARGANISIEYFAGGTLLEGAAILDGMLNGVADMGHLSFSYYPGRFPVISYFEYPFNFASATSAGYVMDEALETLQPAELDGIQLLVTYGGGPGAILSNKKLETVSDFQGFQIRANALQGEGMQALGATPANIAMGECYEALRTGVVDGFVGLQEAGYAYNLQEVVDYFIFYPYANCVMSLAISDAAMAKLTADQQQLMREASREVFETSAASYCGVAGHRTSDALVELGGEVLSFDQTALDEIDSLLAPIIAEYAQELSAQGFDGDGIMQMMYDLTEKYNALYPND